MSLYSIVFFKQKSAYELRISDWSSDVCSSDLPGSMPGCFNVPTRRYSNGRVFVYCSGAVSPFVKQADAQRTSVAPMVKATPSAAVRGLPSSREAMLDAAETVVVKHGAVRLTLYAVAKHRPEERRGGKEC